MSAYNITFNGTGDHHGNNLFSNSAYYNASGRSETFMSKMKGDEGIYAAVDAVRLARALKGITVSRLEHFTRLKVFHHANFNSTIHNSEEGVILLGAPPASFGENAANTNINLTQNVSNTTMERQAKATLSDVFVNRRSARLNHLGNEGTEVLGDIAEMNTQIPVGLPDDVLLTELRELIPFVRKVKPDDVLDYEGLMRLFYFLRMPGNLRSREGESETPNRIMNLDLSDGVVAPQIQPEISMNALLKKMDALRERYPLPVPVPKKGKDKGDDDEDDEEEEEERDPEELRHNAALRARCEKLGLGYEGYKRALEAVARHETRVFAVLCQYLSQDTQVQVLSLRENMLGADESAKPVYYDKEGGSAGAGGNEEAGGGTVALWPLHCLARLIDTNETIKVLDLSHNQLGPNGVAIVAKALTKNIAIRMLDLTGNQMDMDSLEEREDPEHEEDDPVFGELAPNPLEALAEVLKKNKFLRVLKLAYNGIHAGEGDEAPEQEDPLAEFEPTTDASDYATALVKAAETDDEDEKQRLLSAVDHDNDATMEGNIASWEGVPLWAFVAPLMKYHKLEVLDLTGNQLRVAGTKMLATALSHNKSLKVLDLTDNDIHFRGLHYLALLVLRSRESALHTLILRRNNLAGKAKTSKKHMRAALAAMTAFSDALAGNRTLRKLVVSSNHLGPQLSAALLHNIAAAEVLEELDFDNNEACGEHYSSGLFDPAAAMAIASAIYRSSHSSAPTLAVLRFSGNNLGRKGAEILFSSAGMAVLPHTLTEVDLSRNKIENTGLAALSTLLISSTTLRRLNLSYNNISSTTLLLPGLNKNASLEDLDLSHNKLGMIEEFNKQNTTVNQSRTTAIFDASATRDSFVRTANSTGTAYHESVQEFDMLMSALACSPSLRALDLSWNDLRSEHAFVLLRYLAVRTPNPSPRGGDNNSSQHRRVAELFQNLKKLDISNNAKLMVSNVQSCIEGIAGRPGLVAFYATPPNLFSLNRDMTSSVTTDGGSGAAATTNGSSSVFNSTHPSLILSAKQKKREADVSLMASQGPAATTASAAAAADDVFAGLSAAERQQLIYSNHLAMLNWIANVVMHSDSLQDIDCGLKRLPYLEDRGTSASGTAAAAASAAATAAAIALDESEESEEGRLIGAIRRKLLLNALVAEAAREGN